MLWLYIILGIILFFAIILAIPIKIKASCKKELFVTAYIGFVKFRLIPEKPKKKKKKKKSKAPSENKPQKPQKKKPNIIERNGLTWLVDIIKKTAALACGVLKDLFKHIIIKKMFISVRVAEGDAAETAIHYGYMCSAIYPAVGIIAKTAKCRKYGVDIAPDFDENAESGYELEFEAKITLLWIIVIILRHGKSLLDILEEFNK